MHKKCLKVLNNLICHLLHIMYVFFLNFLLLNGILLRIKFAPREGGVWGGAGVGVGANSIINVLFLFIIIHFLLS